MKRGRRERRNTEEDGEERDQEKKGKAKEHTEQRGATDARARVERGGEADMRGMAPGLDAGRAEQEEEDAGMEVEEVEGGEEGERREKKRKRKRHGVRKGGGQRRHERMNRKKGAEPETTGGPSDPFGNLT